MKSDNNDVALQGIEFWSTVCDEEQDLAIEAAEVMFFKWESIGINFIIVVTARANVKSKW